ncbi:hypothetical protein E5S69_11640 [Cupriavidus necator]|uniref:hypothetical protein n=1 Tax=Cupriavidus necator TaxID=106590 RepID=UPI00148FE6D3|nr:hypothetical protein [Cupriavidus necator]NOV24164.1 hypothetical protein [Cupriavidus necator]
MVTVREIAWAAGFLEGEGSFTQSRTCPAVTAAQVQREPLERLQAIFGGTVRLIDRANRKPTEQPHYRWDMYGSKAIAVMMTLWLLMSPRRKEQIEKVINDWKARSKRGSHHRNMTACKAGHPYVDGSWTRKGANGRQCKECMNLYRANHSARQEK